MTRANGEGTIYRRKDGRYEGAAYVLTAAGTRKRVRVYGRTRDEANRKLIELIRQSQKGIPVAGTSQTVAGYLEHWLEHIAAHQVRPKTFEGYASNIRKHITPLVGKKKLARLTARDIRSMLDDLRIKGLKPRSVQYVHATLRVALEHAVREELLPRNVAKLVQVPRPSRPEIEPLSVNEAKLLLKTVRNDRLYALYVLTLVLGMRRGEALALRWADVDLAGQTLKIRQSLQRVDKQLQFLPPKTQRSRRTVPLPPLCVDALREHRQRQLAEQRDSVQPWPATDLVFTTAKGTPIEPRSFTRMFQDLCEETIGRRLRLHDLRHTCVSLLLALGVHPRVVMEIVGHSAVEMTMNVYGHVALDTQREALGRLNELLDE